jgi:hypothetical protein
MVIPARLDRDVCDWLRRYGAGYSTRINNIGDVQITIARTAVLLWRPSVR